MSDKEFSNSVGLVKSQHIDFNESLTLDCGHTLSKFTLAYETYGKLNATRSNAVLICHALSGDQHAAGYHSATDKKPGWWDNCIGPNKAFDTNRFFFICPNNLGGCSGSSGPNTVNPKTGKRYALDFPIVTVKDWVRSQNMLREAFDIPRWAAVIGGSLGGMQAMQWAIDYPDKIAYALLIATAPRLSAQNIAFNEVARQAIVSDPSFCGGNYYDDGIPQKGLMLARMLGHITYLSDDAMREKFGRELKATKLNYGFDVEFQVESYLRYQGESFVNRFDANTYLLMTKALDYFDPAAEYDGELSVAFKKASCGFLVISFSADWRFSTTRSHEIVKALVHSNRRVSYCEIKAQHGHDSFLMPVPQYHKILRAYMAQIETES